MIRAVREWARIITRDTVALALAARDPRVPLVAKLVAVAIAAYALSPIDLIPDFVPVVGYLDDLVIVPVGILLAIKLIPPDLMTEFRHTAVEAGAVSALGRRGAVFIVMLWIVGGVLALVWLRGVLS